MSFDPRPDDRQTVQDFQTEIAANPQEYDNRLVFADWLDEHGYYEEAERQRKYKASEAWLQEFAKNHDDFAFDYSDEKYPPDFENNGYMQLLYFLEMHGDGEEQEETRFLPFDTPYEFEDYSDELWEHYEIVTGNTAPARDAEYRNTRPPFRCAC